MGWVKDSGAVYSGGRGEWSPEVGPMVNKIGHNYQEAALVLVSKAYSTIRISDLANYLGQSEAEAAARVSSLGWGFAQDKGVVTPRQERVDRSVVAPTEEQLNRLTSFISFLEN